MPFLLFLFFSIFTYTEVGFVPVSKPCELQTARNA